MMTDSNCGSSSSSSEQAPGALPRAFAYVDGFNLYHGQLRRSPQHKWIDIEALTRRLMPGYDLQGVVYCIARVVDMPHDPDVSTRQDVFLRALQAHCANLEVIEGQFKLRKVTGRRIHQMTCDCCSVGASVICDCCTRITATIEKYEEKGSDVNVATRLLRDGFRDMYDTALVISGDSDLQPAVDVVRKELGKKVVVCDPRLRRSRPLRGDEMRSIRAAALTACQMPRPVVDRDGNAIHPPKTWE